MRSYIIGLTVMIGILASAENVKGQDSIRFISNADTTIGIPIKKDDLNKRISKYVMLMSNWTKFTPMDYVVMVRLYNTIGNSHLLQVDYYRMYYQIFTVMNLKDVGKTLDAHLMKGLSLYSKKYNIWIGDRPYGNNNSEYRIKD